MSQADELKLTVKLPEEYIGIHPDLILQDVIQNPKAWDISVAAHPDTAAVKAAVEALTHAKDRLAAISEGSQENFAVYGECLQAIEALRAIGNLGDGG